MAPPPLSDLLDWRVPYVELLAMISVSRVYACDSLLDGVRAPPRAGRPSPAARADGAMQMASRVAVAPPRRRFDLEVLPFLVAGVRGSATAPRGGGRGARRVMSLQRRAALGHAPEPLTRRGARSPRTAHGRAGTADAVP